MWSSFHKHKQRDYLLIPAEPQPCLFCEVGDKRIDSNPTNQEKKCIKIQAYISDSGLISLKLVLVSIDYCTNTVKKEKTMRFSDEWNQNYNIELLKLLQRLLLACLLFEDHAKHNWRKTSKEIGKKDMQKRRWWFHSDRTMAGWPSWLDPSIIFHFMLQHMPLCTIFWLELHDEKFQWRALLAKENTSADEEKLVCNMNFLPPPSIKMLSKPVKTSDTFQSITS